MATTPTSWTDHQLSRPRKRIYPVLYGDRKLLNRVRWVKPLLDRTGLWTLTRRQGKRPLPRPFRKRGTR